MPSIALFLGLSTLALWRGALCQDDPPTAGSRLAFTINRSFKEPWSSIDILLPKQHPLYNHFQARVRDVTQGLEDHEPEVNFTSTSSNPNVIRIRSLSPGRTYSVAITGQKADKIELIKEETVTMKPKAPDFSPEGIIPGTNNITLITNKDGKAVQDSFRIEYRQLDPERVFSVLEVLDIPEQKQLEVYLGNLSPGRDYNVRITSLRSGLNSTPWESTITTVPSSVSRLTITENNTCVDLSWVAGDGGVDEYTIAFRKESEESNRTVAVLAPSTSAHLCDVAAGESYEFIVTPSKSNVKGVPTKAAHVVRPLPPIDFKVRPDLTKGKYKIFIELSARTKVDFCKVSVFGETVDKIEVIANLDTKTGKRACSNYLSLAPGERYEFSVVTSSHNFTSSRLQRSIVLKPAFNMDDFGLVVKETKGGLEMSWPQSETFMSRVKDVWGKVVGSDSLLQLRVKPLSSRAETMNFESSPSKPASIFVPSLTKGACYRVQIYTVTKSGIISETPYDERLRTSAPPVNASLHEVTQNTATLTMNLQNDEEPLAECQLNVMVLDMHGQTVLDKRLPLHLPLPSIQLKGLRPFHKYTVNTKIVCGLDSSDCPPSTRTMRQITFSTMQDRPGPVQSFTVRPLNPYTVQLSWLPPALPNGLLTHYITEVVPLENEEQAPWRRNVSLNREKSDISLDTVIDGLVGGLRYNFTVRAATEAGAGEDPKTGPISLTMPILAPPRPNVGPQVNEESIGPYSASVRLPTAMFDSKNGRIIRSAIVVAEVTESGKTSETWMTNETYTWRQVQQFDLWPSYTALFTDTPQPGRNAPLTETIGIDQTCADQSAHVVCNGPLKPGSFYKFKLRLYTSPELFTDSPFSEVVTTENAPSGLTLRIVVILLIILLSLGVFAVLCILFWNRSKKERDAAYSSKESQWAALKMIMAERAADCLAKLGLDGGAESQAEPAPNHLQATFGHHRRCRSLRERTGVDHRLERLPSGPFYKAPLYTVIPGTNILKSRPVRKADFEAHVRNMSADSEFRFSEEYESLKNIGIGQSYHAADLAVNRPKNRFTNILPYDHSRVRLINVGDEEGADYINANYIPGFSSRREFIAAQGPLPSTRDAFWQMAWEQQCPAIIALTKCVEKGRDKCHQYWPDTERRTVTYADIEVTLMCETHYEEYTIRDLRLQRKHDPSPPRIVTHLHYMAWPDFGVPEHPEGIVRFAHLFRNKLPHSAHNKPTIVHCSAGVGRSGTFVTIDRLLYGLHMDRPIDVYGIVHEMRMDRCHMVQNEQQYIFIHHVILHVLQSGIIPLTNSVEKSEIHQNPAFEEEEVIAESGF